MAEPTDQTPEIGGATAPIEPAYFCETERYKSITRLCAYFDGTQYKDRPDFWTGKRPDGGSVRVPLRERAPCVIYPLPKAAVQQATRFTFGDGRYPKVKAEPTDKTGDIADLKLSKDEAANITRYISELTEQASLRPMMRTLLRHGLSAKTSVAMLAVRRGKFAVDIAHAKDCWPTFRNDDPSDDVISLVWCYRFSKMVPDKDGKPTYRDHFFRRDVTETAVVVYEDAVAPESDDDVKWTIDGQQTKPHGLGFCPVVWIRNMAEACSGDIDGISLYDGLEDEFDALNFALSQRHRGIVTFGVPQPWETGVVDGDGPGATGRTSRMTGPAGYKSGAAMALSASPHGASSNGTTPARPSGPDELWSYEGDNVELGLLETTGKAFEAASLHVNDIRSRLLEAMSVVLVDASTVAGKGDMSAKFLAMVYQDLLSLVDDLRPCWWQYGLCRILNMMLRMTAVLGGESILVPGATEAAAILVKRTVKFDGVTLWIPPKLTPAWGGYFSPSNDEIKKGVEASVEAREGKIIPAKEATEFVAKYFAIDDVDEAVGRLTQEADAEQQLHPTLDQVVKTISAGGVAARVKDTIKGGNGAGNADPSGTPGGGSEKQAQA